MEEAGHSFFENNARFITLTRSRMRKASVAKALAIGAKLVNKAPAKTMQDRQCMSKALFCANDATSAQDRTLMDGQWDLLGRSSDIALLQHKDILFNGSLVALYIDLKS